MKEHELKIDLEYYNLIKAGIKKYEIRKNDRNFEVGDFLFLRVFDRKTKIYFTKYTPLNVEITHILDDFIGLKNDYVILSFKIK